EGSSASTSEVAGVDSSNTIAFKEVDDTSDWSVAL
ncbi:hypothetical protein AVEN_29861-1, partial [Araneus ventricosus]